MHLDPCAENAPITLVNTGSYACPYCRAANERIAEVRDQFGDRLRYVFRHRPVRGSDLALRAAELVEQANDSMCLGASVVSAVIGMVVLWSAGRLANGDENAVQPDAATPERQRARSLRRM